LSGSGESINLSGNGKVVHTTFADMLTQDQLNKLGMTEEEVLEYCGC